MGTKEEFYFAVVDNQDIFRGFILARDHFEANTKARRFRLKVYGKKIMRSFEDDKYGRKIPNIPKDNYSL